MRESSSIELTRGGSPLREQLDLFPAVATPKLSHVDRLFQIAFSDEVTADILALAQSRVGDWLEWRDFRPVIDKHGISSCFGHAIYHLAREGFLIEQHCYFGSRSPCEGNYLGYFSRYAALGTKGPLEMTEVRHGW